MTRLGRDLLVFVVAAALLVVVPASPSSAALDPVSIFGRAFVQTLLTPFRKGAAYESAEQRRDADLAAIAVTADARTWQHDKGWLDDATYERQQAALAALRKMVTARAEREKKMARRDYDRALGSEWLGAVDNAVTGLATANLRTDGLVGELLAGRSPWQVAADRLLNTPVTSYDDLAAVQKELDRADALRRAVRDPSGVLEASIGDLRTMLAANVPQNRGEPLPASFLSVYQDKARALAQRIQTLTSKANKLTASRVRLGPERFARDPAWSELTTAILSEGSIPLSNRLPLAAIYPRVRARFDQLAADRPVTADQRATIVLRVLAWYLSVAEQQAARVANPPVFDLDASLRGALDEIAPAPTTSTSHDDASEWADRKASRSAEPGEQLVLTLAPPYLSSPWGQFMASGANGSVNAQVSGSNGSLVLDFDSRSLTGEIAVGYDCGQGNCTEPGTFANGEGRLRFAGTATPSASPLSVWDVAGTVEVTAHGKADHCGSTYPCPFEATVAGGGTFTGTVSKGLFQIEVRADHLAEPSPWLVSEGLSLRITEDVPGP